MKNYRKYTEEELIKIAKEYKSFNGFKCGLTAFDNIIRLDKSSLTVIVARPQSGKSTFINYYTFLMGKNNNWKTLYFTFETPIAKEIKYLSALYKSYSETAKHSIFFDLTELKTIEDLTNMIKQAKNENNIDCVVLDNFTNLQFLSNKDINTYVIGNILSVLKNIAVELNLSILLITHTTKMDDGEEINPYKVCGSANFFNISDFMFSLEVTDREKKITEIKALKIRDGKEKGIINGIAHLQYNEKDNSYSSIDNIDDFSFEDKAINRENLSPLNDTDKELSNEEKTSENKPFKTIDRAIFDKPLFGYYENIKEKKPNKIITLNDWINITKSEMAKYSVYELRGIDKDKEQEKYTELKATLPLITPSVIMSNSKSVNDINSYNNIICIDIDKGPNKVLTVNQMKEKANSLPFVMFTSLSAGGKGIYCLVPVAENANIQTHKQYCDALIQQFKEIGLEPDSSCINPNRLRFLSYDSEPYINYNCQVFETEIKENKENTITFDNDNLDIKTKLSEEQKETIITVCNDIEKYNIDIFSKIDGDRDRHTNTLNIAQYFAQMFGESGLKLFLQIREVAEHPNSFKHEQEYMDVLNYVESGKCETKYPYNCFMKRVEKVQLERTKIKGLK